MHHISASILESVNKLQVHILCGTSFFQLYLGYNGPIGLTLMIRDVTKFEFELLEYFGVFERFQQIRNLTNILSTLLINVNSWKICSTTDFICTECSIIFAQ